MKTITITEDQLVERKGGWTTYINDAGTKCKARNSQIRVLEDGEDEGDDEQELDQAAATSAETEDEADGEGEDNPHAGKRRVGNTWHDCSQYTKAKSASGNKSLHCGDQLAQQLAAATLDDVYEEAAKVLGVTEASLRAKYRGLNLGMQRMNLGNRMRAAARKRAALAAA